MKTKILFFVALLLGLTGFSQTPEEISFQALIRDSNGNLLTNQNIGMRISVLESSINGAVVYSETHTVSTNANGLVSLEIGTGTLVSGSFSGINWGAKPHFLRHETDITGGTNYTFISTNQLLSVPYALHAKTSGVTYKVGDFAHGGIVFYVDESGKHGLVVSKDDLSDSITWFASGFKSTQAKANGLHAGKQNTAIIIALRAALVDNDATSPETSTYAARLANEFSEDLNGITYGGWYLPSSYELTLLFQNKTAVNTSASANGGTALSSSSYWSSTEVSSSRANVTDLSNGTVSDALKTGVNKVRAIRSF